MRARLAITAAGRTVRLREVVLRNKPAELITASPKATVPVLVLNKGEVIAESRDIMTWAFSGHAESGLCLGWGDPQANALLEQNDGVFKQALDRYKYPNRYPGTDPLLYRAKAAAILQGLETQLAQHGGQLSGPDPRAIDLAIFPFVRQFAQHDRMWFDAQPWSHLTGWLNGHMESALFARIMGKYPAWKSPHDDIEFPPGE